MTRRRPVNRMFFPSACKEHNGLGSWRAGRRISRDGVTVIVTLRDCDPERERSERRFGTVDFRVLPAQFRAQIDRLCTVLADESEG
jgi:hypothetical protein